VAWLAERLGLRRGRVVLDVAAGTGKLTRLLVPKRAQVVAVEPLAEMRAVLRQAVPEAEALEGTAEGLPLPDSCADAVTAASAFHWFRPVEALAEVARMLRPGGQLAVVYGKRDWESELQRREREEFLAQVRELGERQVSPFAFPYATQIWVAAAASARRAVPGTCLAPG